ncbi:MAG TPA: TonB family protein [Terriglobales bacterium]|nr:TonB family protein [Terriglobales bacterium]
MSQPGAPFPNPGQANQRHFPRYPVAVPVDVVVLRSGIPKAIPGRSLDAGEGGIGVVLAGELRPEETVGIVFSLPTGAQPVQVKAVVRHYGPIRCGLQFLAIAPEQQAALQTWIRMTAGASPKPAAMVARKTSVSHEPAAHVQPSRGVQPGHSRFQRHRRSVLLVAAALVVAGVALASWWHSGWNDLERSTSTASANTAQPLAYVPGSVMEQRVLHKVEPAYPPEAERAKVQGVVVLQAVIGADGAVTEVHPISGPEALGLAASDAVRWWRFQPYQLDGRPVAVQTTIEVQFQLNP